MLIISTQRKKFYQDLKHSNFNFFFMVPSATEYSCLFKYMYLAWPKIPLDFFVLLSCVLLTAYFDEGWLWVYRQICSLVFLSLQSSPIYPNK